MAGTDGEEEKDPAVCGCGTGENDEKRRGGDYAGPARPDCPAIGTAFGHEGADNDGGGD